MLQAIRSKAGSFVVKLLFVLLILTFGIWGIGDIFRTASSDTSVATVEALFLKLSQGASAGTAGSLKRLRMLHQAIVDREEQGETLSRLLPTGVAEKLRRDGKNIGQVRTPGQITQAADGSWHVKSRSIWLQPYFESGFPHGKFQFISFAGTCWATMALMYAAG